MTPPWCGTPAALGWAGLLVATLGAIFTLTPWGGALEETITLDSLFALRGVRPASEAVAVASLSPETARILGLPRQLDRWSRRLHVSALETLHREGASVIAYDLLFNEHRDVPGDASFAQALQRHGKALIVETRAQEVLADGVTLERTQLPVPLLRQAAAATAPFLLPKGRSGLRQVWLFHGATPTLPLVALQLHALPLYDHFRAVLADLAPTQTRRLPPDEITVRAQGQVQQLARTLRQLFLENPALQKKVRAALAQTPTLTPAERALLDALTCAYSGAESRYLNFFGPPGHLFTVPYHVLLQADAPVPVRGRAVFIGFAAQPLQEQRDSFTTVYSRPDGSDLSGVEIAATAYANLIQDDFIRALPGYEQALIGFVWAILVVAAFIKWRLRYAATLIAVLTLIYTAIVYFAFIQAAYWLPWAVPMLLQLPLLLLVATLWHAICHAQRRDALQQAFSQYVPPSVVAGLADAQGEVRAQGQVVYATCLATDGARYTTLAEQLAPSELTNLLNRYYEVLFTCVRRHHGIISDVVGDAMLALWTSPQADAALRAQACASALEIDAQVQRFNATQTPSIPTRLGLHSGPVMLGTIGAPGHYEFRAVGDIVNVATRIEGLNKHLGTRVLASRETVADQAHLLCRYVGDFIFAGKTTALAIYEILGHADAADVSLTQYLADFAGALAAFHAQRWQEAQTHFAALSARRPDDGPTRYFHQLCASFHQAPPPSPWDGAIRLAGK